MIVTQNLTKDRCLIAQYIPEKIFSDDGGLSVWSGIWYSDKALFAAAGTKTKPTNGLSKP